MTDELVTAPAESGKSAREAVTFCAVTFLFTWTLHAALIVSGLPLTFDEALPAALYGVGLIGPTLAAFAVERRTRGREGRSRLLRAASPRTMTTGRVVAALTLPLLMMLLAVTLSGGDLRIRPVDPLLLLAQVWVVMGEEFGWRGFLLPRLRRAVPAMAAVAVMTATWGAWHLPMFFVDGSLQAQDGVGHFVAAIFAWSAVHHVLQVGRPSVAIAMLFHAAGNITVQLLDVGGDRVWLTSAYVATGAAATVLAAWRERRVRMHDVSL
jgi:uncharacterized protein